MTSSESPSAVMESLNGGERIQAPAIEAADREYLITASAISGSHYGARIGSNAALWALAIQRQDIDKRLSALTARNQRRLRSARYAVIAAIILGVMSTVGAAYYARQSNSRSTLTNGSAAQMPKATIAPPVRPQTPNVLSSVPTDGGNTLVAQKNNAPTARAKQPIVKISRKHSHVKRRARPVHARSSRWIAQPLHGEALRRALIADRKRTKELNEAQLKLTRRRRD